MADDTPKHETELGRVIREKMAESGAAQLRGDARLVAAADRIVRAMTDPGSHPDYHYRQMVRLEQEWPSLYNAIAELMAARGWTWPPDFQRKLDRSL